MSELDTEFRLISLNTTFREYLEKSGNEGTTKEMAYTYMLLAILTKLEILEIKMDRLEN